ncbi:MAG: VPLPA-CTERM sorting domain-containing protein [Parvularculaceae bacterium]
MRNPTSEPLALLAAVLSTFGLCAPAGATPVTWTLADAVFSDGGTASGTFIYDADANVYSNVDIVTTAGSKQSGAEYHLLPSLFAFSATRFGAVPVASPALSGKTIFSITWASALTNDGGIVGILTGSPSGEGVCSNFNCSIFTGFGGGARNFVSGYATTASEVPLPAALPLFFAGFAGLGAASRRQRIV